MDRLEKLSRFIYDQYIEREQFLVNSKKIIKEQAQSITLQEILDNTPKELAKDTAYNLNTFEYGTPINYLILRGWFEITLNPAELALKDKTQVLKTFTGPRVKKFYELLVSDIQKEITTYLENLPF